MFASNGAANGTPHVRSARPTIGNFGIGSQLASPYTTMSPRKWASHGNRSMKPKSTGFVAYYRVSTDGQGRSGLGLEAQRAAVGAYLASVGGTLLAEFTEVETGKRNERPELH
jgi:Resolvase, N terminal domain